MATNATNWVKSTYSDDENANCVEWVPTRALDHGTIPVRDSKTRDTPHLTLSSPAWTAFVSAVKVSAI
jgi:hypothetical protein